MFVQVTTFLIVTCAFFLSFRSAATFRKNVVLNVTLPFKAQSDPRVQKMIADYKKGNVFLTLLALGGGALILLAQEVSLFLVLFMVWIGMSLIGGILLVNSYSAKLMRLKGEEGWWAGSRDVVKVDLTVSREKGRLPVSKLWVLPATLISLGLLVWGQPTLALLGLLLGLFLVFLALDTSDYALRITETEIVVQAPLYGFSFATEDIKSVSLVQNVPGGTRTNGAETGRYAIGNYTLWGLGPSKLYVYKNSPPYISIELPRLHVFFNTKTPEKTLEYFERLQEIVP